MQSIAIVSLTVWGMSHMAATIAMLRFKPRRVLMIAGTAMLTTIQPSAYASKALPKRRTARKL